PARWARSLSRSKLDKRNKGKYILWGGSGGLIAGFACLRVVVAPRLTAAPVEVSWGLSSLPPQRSPSRVTPAVTAAHPVHLYENTPAGRRNPARRRADRPSCPRRRSSRRMDLNPGRDSRGRAPIPGPGRDP